jgi:pimeloyl-ACP methyl ester carboxylesterase
MRWLVLVAICGCGDDQMQAPIDAAPSVDAAPPQMDAACLSGGLYAFTLDAGAFPPSPDHPSVVVYVPSRFNPTPPLEVVVFIHGFDNCALNIVRDAGVACSDGGVREAYALAAQLEASNRNALLLCPEVAFDQSSSNPGALANPGAFAALLDDTLANLPLGTRNVGRLIVASHSGGYAAAAAIASVGGVQVDELYLFDSLYAETAQFDAWVMSDLGGLATLSRRFADVYTSGGGTLTNSQDMATRAAGWVPAGEIVDDRTTATWPDETYRHGLLFKLSALSHDGVPRYYFERLLSTSSLSARTCP